VPNNPRNNRQAARDHANTNREQGGRVARATDLENTRNSRGGSNTQKAIRDRATGNAAQRRS
jgi:hypothetical protein